MFEDGFASSHSVHFTKPNTPVITNVGFPEMKNHK